MNDITYENVVEKLLVALPELQIAYDMERNDTPWYGDAPDCYAVFERIFNEQVYLWYDEREDPKALDALKRAFAFLEKLSCIETFEMESLVQVAVNEAFFCKDQFMSQIAPYMGPKTRKLAIAYGQQWGYDMSCFTENT